MSHLLGVYPGDLVTVDNKEYMDAAKVSLTERGDNATGWGIAQRLNTWARTGDGNHSYQIINQFIKTGIYSNLWDSHAPYQIDGNFGFTSGVAEMLLQSNAGYINLLPAMPDNQWTTGSVSGLVARGNFEVSESWKDGALTEATILSKNGGTCTVQAGDWKYVEVRDSKGDKVPVSDVEGKDGRVTFETTKGERYVLTKSETPSAENVIVTFKDGDKTIETKTVVKGEAIGSIPQAPEKEGYTFKEWNTEKDGKGDIVTAETTAEGDMTAYAIFEQRGPVSPEKPDKTEAQKYYDACLSYYLKGDYTAESWKVYESAMNALKAALADENISKEDLQAAIDAVAKAAKELKAIETSAPDENKDSNESNKSNGVKTGDTVSVGGTVSGLAVAILAIAVVILKKRRKC